MVRTLWKAVCVFCVVCQTWQHKRSMNVRKSRIREGDIVPSTLRELTFNEKNAAGDYVLRVFPAGTHTEQPHPNAVNEEITICKTRIDEMARKGERGFMVMMLGGRVRMLDRAYFDPLFRQ